MNNAEIGDSTALMKANGNGHTKVVKILLEHGAQVNSRTFNGNALISACSKGYIEVVKLLLANRASVNAETET